MKKTIYKWERSIFGDIYNIYKGDSIISNFIFKFFSNKADVILKGKRFEFRTKGFLKQTTKIIDLDNNKVFGVIKYSAWGRTADITIDNINYLWKPKNIFQSSWNIFYSDEPVVIFKNSYGSGYLESNDDKELVILAGIFVQSYLSQMAMITIFMALIASSSSILIN